MRHKTERQAAVLAILRRKTAHNQSEIVELVRKAGFDATQASISRDIRELGLVKVNGRYTRLGPPVDNSNGPAAPAGSELITSIQPVGANLVIVRTGVGAASAVAAKLDSLKLPEVAGSLAGDDTIFVAVSSRAAQGRFIAHLREWNGKAV